MEVFYSDNIADGRAILPEEESRHCIRVLRHRCGDRVYLSGGDGNLYECTVEDDNPRRAVLTIVSVAGNPSPRNYRLCMAVAPTKNADRFEWFLEKSVETGVDRIVPLCCVHSERKIFNAERGRKIVLSAAKQSLKGNIPQLDEMTGFREFVQEAGESRDSKFIAYCGEYLSDKDDGRMSLQEAVASVLSGTGSCTVLIGPEGDFSGDEIEAALENGFRPLSLGPSRLRTETAALLCVSAFYYSDSCR